MSKNSQSKHQADLKQDKALKSSLDFTKTFTDHIAVSIIMVLGSMRFLVACIIVFVVWICWNVDFFPDLKPFDPFPFPILEMIVSLFAIVLSVSVLINQNRQGKIEKIRQQVEFEINVRAENEVTKILNIVHEIHQHLGLDRKHDPELEQMKETTDIKQIHQTVDDKEAENKLFSDN